MANRRTELLPGAPMRISKAPRGEHPTAPPAASPASPVAAAPVPAAGEGRDEERTPRRGPASENRLGPGKTRKSFYMSQDVADRLSEEVNRLHHQSNGRFAKNDVLDAIILAGLSRLDDVQYRLDTNNPA